MGGLFLESIPIHHSENQMTDKIETHPVQANRHRVQSARVPKAVTLKAYEVYKEVHGPQEALITGHCRGGFGVGELVCYLYAASFPRHEWRMRVDEAMNGMEYLD